MRIVPSKRVDAIDEHDQSRVPELLEQARREQRDFVARLELALVFKTALFGPRRQKQRQHDDGDQEGAANRRIGSATP